MMISLVSIGNSSVFLPSRTMAPCPDFIFLISHLWTLGFCSPSFDVLDSSILDAGIPSSFLEQLLDQTR